MPRGGGKAGAKTRAPPPADIEAPAVDADKLKVEALALVVRGRRSIRILHATTNHRENCSLTEGRAT